MSPPDRPARPASKNRPALPQEIDGENRLAPLQHDLQVPRSDEYRPENTHLPSFLEFCRGDLPNSVSSRVAPLSQHIQHEHSQPRLPISYPEYTARSLVPMARPHSASNRYEPYPQRKHSTRGFVGRRDIGNYSLYHDVYHDAQHSEHGYRGSHFDPGQSALLYETRRVYAIDPPIPHCITDNGYPFGRFPVRQHHHSLNHPAGRYLNVHQLPSQRGSVETDVRYPTSHGDYQYPQPHTSCDTRPPQPQASSECAPSDSRLTRSEDKGNNPIDDNVRSPQAVKVNSRRSKRSKSPISDDRWTTFCVNIGKQKGYQGDCYRCEYPVWKDGKLEPCNFGSFGSEKNTVKRHANAVHLNIREHECEYCPKAFSQKQALRVHMNTVHRDKGRVRPFPCKHCNQDFGDPSKRNKHYRKAHPEVEIKPRKNLPRRAIDIDAEPPLPVPASNAE